MNLNHLSNQALIEKTKCLVKEERKITTEILQCLQIVEARKIFAELGFPSLYEFTTRYLGYSEGSAHRRISAMRLLRTLPIAIQKETEQKIQTGTISLTNLAQLQSFLNAEKKLGENTYSTQDKIDLVQSVESKSKREVEKVLVKIQPAIVPVEKERVITDELTEIKFIAKESLMKKLERIKQLTAHGNCNPTYAELLEKMADLVLTKLDPLQNKPARVAQVNEHVTNESFSQKKEPSSEATHKLETGSKPSKVDAPEKSFTIKSHFTSPARSEQTVLRSRYIPQSVKIQVFTRDQSRCTFVHSQTQQACGSSFGLELDHIQPFAQGGQNTVENLRLRCKQHNQLHAIRSGLWRSLRVKGESIVS